MKKDKEVSLDSSESLEQRAKLEEEVEMMIRSLRSGIELIRHRSQFGYSFFPCNRDFFVDLNSGEQYTSTPSLGTQQRIHVVKGVIERGDASRYCQADYFSIANDDVPYCLKAIENTRLYVVELK